MRQIATIDALRASVASARSSGHSVGLVPTMGALHEGHSSLIEAAVRDGHGCVVTTIFVNPLQFAPTEDLDAYPRDLEGDRALARAAGATLLFTPPVEEMYPFGARNVLTTISVREITAVLDGLARPGHFDGVATVVAKLFAIVGPCDAYFGEKDFQQLAVIRRMVLDLCFPVKVVGCPTVREPNGLARSSRNRYLTSAERDAAAVLSAALRHGASLVEEGERDPARVSAAMVRLLQARPEVSHIDYAACVDPDTLAAPAVINGPVRLLVAARLGRARLIDNVGASPRVR